MNQIRRNFLKKLISTAYFASIFPSYQLVTADASSKFPRRHPAKFKKIDIHTHISSDAQYLKEVMEEMNLKMFTICNEGLKSDRLTAQKNDSLRVMLSRLFDGQPIRT